MHSKPIATLIRCGLCLALAGCAQQSPAGATNAESQTSGAETEVSVDKVEAPEPQAGAVEQAESPPAEEDPGPQPIRVSGFSTPEAVYYHEASDTYLVSSINGSPLEKDDNGFISRVSPEGEISELKWIDGAAEEVTLNAPKGMAVAGDTLLVADIDAVRLFDANSGKPQGEIAIKGATFLNALSVGPEGSIYVSDSGLKADAGGEGFAPSGSDAIYGLDVAKKRSKRLIKSNELGGPNGLLATDDGVWVVAFRDNQLYRVTPEGKRVDAQALPKGSLDGIVRTEKGQLLISSWEANGIYRGEPGGEFALVVKDMESPAAIGYDGKRDRLLVPLFTKNEAVLYPLALVQPAAATAQERTEPQPAEAEAPPAEPTTKAAPAEPGAAAPAKPQAATQAAPKAAAAAPARPQTAAQAAPKAAAAAPDAAQ